MRFEGHVVVRAARADVWRFLTDPRQVSQCAPGVEALEILGPERFRARAAVGFGSVKAQFVTEAEWLDLDPPTRARMKAHGTAPGSAVDASSEMLLSDAEGGGTSLRWSADVAVVGTLASLAARLMGSVAQRLTEGFFDAVRRRIEAQAPAPRRAFRFGPRPLDEALGAILGHNVKGADGRVALSKGRTLTSDDLELLRSLGFVSAEVAEPGEGDVLEDEAARRVAQAAMGGGLRLAEQGAGRASLVATRAGLVQLDPGRLWRVNSCDGLAVATLREHAVVAEGDLVASVKALPFALPLATVEQAETAASEGGALVDVRPFVVCEVALLLTAARDDAAAGVRAAFEPPLRARVERWGSRLRAPESVALDGERGESALAERLRAAADSGAGLILVAGEAAIVDRHDLVPRAIERAGGEVVVFGVPVDPGQLLLLAYLGPVAVVGAPACARSPQDNVIDLILPRLLAGERLGRADLVGLGHGGLRADVPERARPR